MSEETGHDESARRSPAKWAFLTFALIGAFFLIAEHRAHILPWLPWLFLAACPLMHMFMHRGHGGHGHRGDRGGPDSTADASTARGATGPGRTSHHQHGDRS